MIKVGALALATVLSLGATAASADVLLRFPKTRKVDFAATFSWAGIPACATVSPAFALSGVPKGTTALAFVMHDQQAPDFEHGGSTVAYSGGGRVAQGTITYVGPCPPSGEKHRYVWTIEARDGAEKVLGRTTAAGRFPP